jgi:hypothetical protein
MPTHIQFDDGRVIQFDGTPSHEDIAAVANKLYPQQTGMLGNIAGAAIKGVGGAVINAGTGILGTLGAGAGALGMTDTADKLIGSARQEHEGGPGSATGDFNDFLTQHGLQPTGAAAVGSNILSSGLPLLNPAVGMAGIANQAGQQAIDRGNQGVDRNTAWGLGTAEAMGQGALGYLVPGATKGIGQAIAGNLAGGALQRAGTKAYLQHEGYNTAADATPDWNDMESMATDAIFGAVAHHLWGEKPKPSDSAPQVNPQGELNLTGGSGGHPVTPEEMSPDLGNNPVRWAQTMAGHGSDVERQYAQGEQWKHEEGPVRGQQEELFSRDEAPHPGDELHGGQGMENEGGRPAEPQTPEPSRTHPDDYADINAANPARPRTFFDRVTRMFDGRELTPEEQAIQDEISKSGRPNRDPIRGEDNALKWQSDFQGAKDIRGLVLDNKIDPHEFLDWAIKNSDSALYRTAARILSKFPRIFDTLQINVHDAGIFDGRADPEGNAGFYANEAHQIYLGHNFATDKVLLHEMYHAVSSRILKMGMRDDAPPIMQKFAKDLESIFNVVTKNNKNKGGVAGQRMDYGFANSHEMLSEAFTSGRFQSFLDKLKIGGQSAYDKIKTAVGIATDTPKPVLHKLMDLVDTLGKYHNDNYSAIDALYHKMLNDQRGISEIGDSLKSPMAAAAESASSDKLHDSPAVEHIRNTIPGMKSTENISRSVDPKVAIGALQAVKDMPKTVGQWLKNNFTISGETLANLERNPGIAMFVSMFSSAHARSHRYAEHVVDALRENIKQVLPDSQWKSLKKIKDVMIKEDLANTRATPGELSKFSPAERQVYNMMRKAFDDHIDHINEKRLALGMDPVTPRDAYMTSHWSGPWKSEVTRTVTDKDGKPQSVNVGWVAGHSMAEVRKGIEYIKKNHPEYQVDENINYRKQLGDKGQNYLQSYKDFVKAFGADSPHSKAFADFINEYYSREGTHIEGYDKHFEKKIGSRFFTGDRPWVDPRKDTIAWYGTQLDHMKQGYKWAEMQDAVAKSGEILKDPGLNKTHPNTLNYLRDYAKVQMGFGKSKLISEFENNFFEGLGRFVDTVPGIRNIPVDLRAATSAMRFAKGLIYMKALGFYKPQHFAVNGVFQPFFTIPRHMKMSSEGIGHDMLETITHGMKDSQAVLANHYSSGLHGGKDIVKLSPFAEKARQYMNENQIATNNPFTDVGDIGQTTQSWISKKTQAIGSYMMQEGERVARVNAFMSFAHHLRQSGKYGDLSQHENMLAMFDEAASHTIQTMGSFKHTDRAMAFTKLGLTGTGLSTLRQFEINFFNQFHDYAKLAIEKGNYGPLLAMSGIQLAYAGVLGFVGMETVDQVWKFLRDLVPTKWSSPEFAQWSPKSFIMKHLPMEAQTGLVSPWSGINFASSLEAGTIVDPSFVGLFPFLSELKNSTVPVWNYISNSSQDNLHKMIYNELPYGMRGTLETGKFMGKDLPQAINTRSWFTSPNGVSQSPNNPGEGQYKRSPQEEFIRSAGFTPAQEAETKARQRVAEENEKSLEERRKGLESQVGSDIRNHDTADLPQLIRAYTRLGGSPSDLLSGTRLHQLLINWATDPRQRLAMGAKNLPSIERYGRESEYQQGVNQYYGPANAANQR